MSGIIICALDLDRTDHEKPVLRRALQLAQLDGARLDVMTVLPDFGSSMVGGYFPANFRENAQAKARAQLSKMVTETLGEEVDHEVRHVVATGRVYDEVIKAAKADTASLIVMGSHRPNLGDYVIGPNAAHVVRHAPCSVLVVRDTD
ncbi:universal stress protein [Pseudoruegeria sp. SK021]|uniref:universal stress protein n=1 Tax=Pseudoruegeria sp. SK021 TaxID=1933035 RepID=UPI000A21500E|nr:universal stress protein [Pseudoruegeria sp. SK021]OSP56599.1 universal stress protein [Pseudoruegeria sp. SK021]